MARKKDPLYREAKKILLNHIELDEDGRFKTTDEVRFQLWGSADGESKTRFLGLSHTTYYYESNENSTQAIYKVEKAMANMGRRINISANRETACVFVKTYLFYPVVLIFYEDDEDGLCLTAYTPRAIFSVFPKMLAARKFTRTVEGIVRPNGDHETLLDKWKEARYQRKAERERKKHKDDDDYESIFDIDWSNPEDEITEDDLIPEDEMPKDEESTAEES